MPIGKALLLKALGGLTALGGAIGGGYSIYDYYINQDTKFDRGLIEFLEAEGDIQFSVKDGNESSSAEITDSFPTFTTGTPPTATATIKVSVGTATGNDVGTLTEKSGAAEGSKAKKTYLQNLNKGSAQGATVTDWTWVCEIKFTKKTDDATATELKDKEKLVKSNDGFFNKLKDSDTNKKNKNLKIKFIKDCAAARGIAENRKINKLGSLSSTTPTANEIKSTKEFKLRKGNAAANEDATKLYPVDQSDFDHWFKNEGN